MVGPSKKVEQLRVYLIEAQKVVWANDLTWAKALQHVYHAGDMTNSEWRACFNLCRGVARPGLDTKDVIPLVCEQLDQLMAVPAAHRAMRNDSK